MRNRMLQLIACILCVTLLFTLGLNIGTITSHHAVANATASNPSENNGTNDKISNVNESATIGQTESYTGSYAESFSAASSKHYASFHIKRNTEIAEALVTVHNIETKQPKSSGSVYEVTAYYLNVREEANTSSKIVDVVTLGSILEVENVTDNGWLALKGGGYVHSGYAKMISSYVGQVPKQSEVKLASAEPAQPVKPTILVKSDSGLTEDHIAKIFEGTALEGEGLEKAVLEVEKDYGINSYFTIAVMKLESGHGKSKIAKKKNNLFGLNAVDSDPFNKALSFETKGDSVEKFGHIISEYYLDEGLTSIDKVAKKYCKANPKWPALVKSIMNSDYKKLSSAA
jgi:flagellum-specific peptidoglycan hydrolase FlgJ